MNFALIVKLTGFWATVSRIFLDIFLDIEEKAIRLLFIETFTDLYVVVL